MKLPTILHDLELLKHGERESSLDFHSCCIPDAKPTQGERTCLHSC